MLFQFRASQFFWRLVQLMNSVPQPQVIGGEDVHATKGKHQKHLRGPAANAFDLHQFFNRVFVRRFPDSAEVNCAVQCTCRQVPQIDSFLSRYPNGLQLLVRQRIDTFRLKPAAR